MNKETLSKANVLNMAIVFIEKQLAEGYMSIKDDMLCHVQGARYVPDPKLNDISESIYKAMEAELKALKDEFESL